MTAFVNQLPESKAAARRRLYHGAIYLLPANAASKEFACCVQELVRHELGENFRQAHEAFDDAEYFARIGKLRKRIYTSAEFHRHVTRVIESFAFELEPALHGETDQGGRFVDKDA